MPTRRVLIHDCEPEVDDGRRFACRCSRLITSPDALALVSGNQAKWKLWITGGRLVEIHSELILPARRHRLNARTISEQDVERAYVENQKYARDRIEMFAQKSEG